jgi:hypothetical protein
MEQYGTANFEILKENRNSSRWVFTFLASHVNSLSIDDDITGIDRISCTGGLKS